MSRGQGRQTAFPPRQDKPRGREDGPFALKICCNLPMLSRRGQRPAKKLRLLPQGFFFQPLAILENEKIRGAWRSSLERILWQGKKGSPGGQGKTPAPGFISKYLCKWRAGRKIASAFFEPYPRDWGEPPFKTRAVYRVRGQKHLRFRPPSCPKFFALARKRRFAQIISLQLRKGKKSNLGAFLRLRIPAVGVRGEEKKTFVPEVGVERRDKVLRFSFFEIYPPHLD